MKKQRGITLIALIITIIVMIILVGVTVSVALNGGLFSTAKDAANGTQVEADREELLSSVVAAMKTDGKIDFSKLPPTGWTGSNGTYTSPKENTFTVTEDGKIRYIEEGKTDKPEYKEEISGLAEGVTVVPYEELEGDIKKAVDDGKIQTVLKETIDGTETIAVVPSGFEISTVDGENSISEGLVIKDGANEFVFIPCPNEYIEDDLGPLTGTTSGRTYDSQEQLDYYYGEGFFNYDNDFDYEQDKTNIETSINKYKGFYVGRYETTIDENGNIGSMKNKPILTSDKSIVQTNNKEVRWYGLYKVQKDLYKNNEAIFSTMVTSKEWDVIMNFTAYGDAKRPTDTYISKPDLSGSAYKDSNPAQYDVSKNIYDLSGNVIEGTLKTFATTGRVSRGGSCNNYYNSASYSDGSSSPVYSLSLHR